MEGPWKVPLSPGEATGVGCSHPCSNLYSIEIGNLTAVSYNIIEHSRPLRGVTPTTLWVQTQAKTAQLVYLVYFTFSYISCQVKRK